MSEDGTGISSRSSPQREGCPKSRSAREEENMAIIAMFEVKGASSAKYDEVIRRLTEIGQRVPDGQMYHICYGDAQNLQVIDVFESQAKLDAFGAKLMPILQDVGIEAKPAIFDLYSIMEGQ
jgi:hypothetical protein